MMRILSQIFKVNVWFTTLFQLSLPIAVYIAINAGVEWYWWAWSLFFYLVIYTLIGNNIGLHRYFTHGHFVVSTPVKWFFLWTGSMIGLGEPLSYAMTHLVHHKHNDTELDPHGPVRGFKSILMIFQKQVNISETPIHSRRMVELGREWGWLHKYYLLFIAINALVLYLISWKVFLFLWWIPASLSCWGIAGAVITQHWSMKPNNGWKHHWLPYYEALHLNHHDYPRAPNTAVYPGEIDYTYQASRIFLPKYNWEGQPGHNNEV